jgi:hypothetical protein
MNERDRSPEIDLKGRFGRRSKSVHLETPSTADTATETDVTNA